MSQEVERALSRFGYIQALAKVGVPFSRLKNLFQFWKSNTKSFMLFIILSKQNELN